MKILEMNSHYIHSRLIPVRFLTLIGHLIMLIMAFSCRDLNVKSCLSYDYTAEDLAQKSKEMEIGLILAMAFIGFELFSFLLGFSMFESLVSVICILSLRKRMPEVFTSAHFF